MSTLILPLTSIEIVIPSLKPGQDLHPADVLAALRKAGWTMRELDRRTGFVEGTHRGTLTRHYPRAERVVADAIGVHPKQLWPMRYDSEGNPRNPIRIKPTTKQRRVHGKTERVA